MYGIPNLANIRLSIAIASMTPVQHPITQIPTLIVFTKNQPIMAPTLELLSRIIAIIVWEGSSIWSIKKKTKQEMAMVEAILKRTIVSLNILPPYVRL